MALRLRDGVRTAETEYGIALLDEDHDQYWTLNPTAAVALRTLREGGTLGDAARALSEEYAVAFDIATRDVQRLVTELRSAGLIDQKVGDI